MDSQIVMRIELQCVICVIIMLEALGVELICSFRMALLLYGESSLDTKLYNMYSYHVRYVNNHEQLSWNIQLNSNDL